MVTGRELPSLRATYPDLGLFDGVVAENGASSHRHAPCDLGRHEKPKLRDSNVR